jgi:hypothetical protein
LRDAVSTAAHGGGSERHGAGHGPVGALDVAGYKDPALRPLAENMVSSREIYLVGGLEHFLFFHINWNNYPN